MTVSVNLSPSPVLQFFDNTGRPCIGGSLQTQVGGINYATYSDNAGTIPLPNPIPLNSRGEVSTAAGATSELFLQQGVAYTFILKDAAGNQLWSVSNIVAPTSGQSITFATVTGTANAIILTNAQPVTVAKGTIVWFIPTAANTAATTINVDNNGAVSVLYLTKALVGGEIQPNVPMQIISDGTNWNLAWSAKGPGTDYYIDSGTTNAIAITVNQVQAGAARFGSRYKVQISNTNTGAATISINGGSTIPIVINDGTLTTNAPAGSLIISSIYDIIISGGGLQAVVENPSRVTGSFTLTLATGLTTTPTVTVNYEVDQTGKGIDILYTANTLATSNGTGLTGTGIPTIIQTATTKRVLHGTSDNGGETIGGFVSGTAGTWTYLHNFSTTGFSATGGSKGVLGGTQAHFTND